jgi:hypothetical protein
MSPKNRILFNFRHQKISQQFIPGGGSLTDVGVQSDYSVRKGLDVSFSVQYERWLIPAIQPQSSQSVTSSLTFRFRPQKSIYPGVRTNSVSSDEPSRGEEAVGQP